MILQGRNWKILVGDVRARLADLPDRSVHCCVTSPPYWGLRDYGVDGQIGLEPTPEQFVANMVAVFREVRRVLRDDGTCWLNLGDSYCSAPNGNIGVASTLTGSLEGQEQYRKARSRRSFRRDKAETGDVRHKAAPDLKPKDLCGIPWLVAFALRDDGWYLRSDIIWHKPNPMPESVTDRPTKAHEYLFLLTKSERYFYDAEAIKEPVRPESVDRCRAGFLGNDPVRDAHNHYGNGFQRGDGYEISSRNRRTVWTISTQPYPEAHFATFPESLVVPCILAGTSEKGCCGDCGRPWERVVEKVRRSTRPGENTKVKVPGGWDIGDGAHGTIHRDGRTSATYQDTAAPGKSITDRVHHPPEVCGNRDPQRHVTEARTTGWKPMCDCGGFQEPCTVLDPFSGSGTTLKVAVELGRQGVGVELNAEYAEMARRRIENPRKYAADGITKIESLDGQKELFA